MPVKSLGSRYEFSVLFSWILMLQFLTEGITTTFEDTWDYVGNSESESKIKAYWGLFKCFFYAAEIHISCSHI